MTPGDLSILKGRIQRLFELVKYQTGGETGFETSQVREANPDHSTYPPDTRSPVPVYGPKRKHRKVKANIRDYAYGQRGKNEAGKTKPGVTGLPAEPPKLVNPWSEHGTPYTEDNL